MTGGVRSATITLNVALPMFPAPSRAVQLTVVLPIGNVFPDPGEQVTAGIGPLTRSTAVGSL